MSWQPTTAQALEQILASQVAGLDSTAVLTWRRFGIRPSPLRCERGGKQENVFCVARNEADVLIYDDVESDFGVGRVDADGVLRAWSTFGELHWALTGLASAASRGSA